MRRAAKVDENQRAIVKALRAIPGMTVEVGHDDILVGFKGRTFWFEVKRPEAVSKRVNEVLASQITESERKRWEEWAGHYRIVWSIDQILADIGAVKLRELED